MNTVTVKARAARLRLQANYHAARAEYYSVDRSFSSSLRTRFRITAEDCAKLEANHRATVSRLLAEAHNLDPEGTP